MNRFRLIPLIFVVLYASCTNNHSLNVPDMVGPSRSSEDAQVPNSQLFLTIPSGFIWDSANDRLILDTVSHLGGPSEAMRVPGDTGTHIDLISYRAEDYKKHLSVYHHRMDSIAHAGGEVFYSKEFQMGSSLAILYYYRSPIKGKESISLMSGDNHNIAWATAVFSATNYHRRDQILQSLLSIYRDEEEGENANTLPFTLDLSGAGFSYYKKVNNVYVYTMGGDNPNDGKTDADVVTVTVLEPHVQPYLAQYLLVMRKNIGQHPREDVEISSGPMTGRLTGKDSTYEMICGLKMIGLPGKFYLRVTGDTAHPIALIAFILHDVDKRLKEVQNAAHTFEVKEHH